MLRPLLVFLLVLTRIGLLVFSFSTRVSCPQKAWQRHRPTPHRLLENALHRRTGRPNDASSRLLSTPSGKGPSSSFSSSAPSSSSPEEYYVISYDGAIAQTSKSRSIRAINAALETWPHLTNLIRRTDVAQDDDDDDYDASSCSSSSSWLVNKMVALNHAMRSSDPDALLGCDSVLLARLLIEEQELDGGRSVGKSGKYASLYHPSSSSSSSSSMFRDGEDDSSSSSQWQRRRQPSGTRSNGSRPLTVGEIGANWVEGGCLVEVLRSRYNVNGKDPLPIVRENLMRPRTSKPLPSPPIDPNIADALSTCTGNIIITVSHSSHLNEAIRSLSDFMPAPVNVASSLTDIVPPHPSVQDKNRNGITIIAPNDSETPMDVIKDLLRTIDHPSDVYVIQSSLPSLQRIKALYGDEMPRQSNGMMGPVSPSVNPRDDNNVVRMKLLLPTWADNTDASHHRTAEMDMWMGVLDVNEFMELLSGRIVTSSLV